MRNPKPRSLALLAAVLATVCGCSTTPRSSHAADNDRPGPPSRPDQPPPPRGENDHGGPQGRRPGGPPDMRRVLDSANLTDAQKEQIKPIMEAFHEKQQKAREEMLAEMKKVLKPDQYEKLEAGMKPPQRDGNGPRDHGRDGPQDGGGPGDHPKGP